jgi:hypothetical protein
VAVPDKSGNPGGRNGFQIALALPEGSDFFRIDIEPQNGETFFTKPQNQREAHISHTDDSDQGVLVKDLPNESVFHIHRLAIFVSSACLL